jgi:protein-S-isoprenylcysteine O-methyltransferase Ste14
MVVRLLRAILILPGTALVLVPIGLLWSFQATALRAVPAGPGDLRAWLGMLLLACGLGFAVWTVRLFVQVGRGTPAPWDPPQRLVVEGPYRHVRNPMISSALMMLAGEALLLGSWPIAVWLLVFFAGNALYFPLVEEKGLRQRFGAAYDHYAENVPRWLPRLTPWRPPDDGS